MHCCHGAQVLEAILVLGRHLHGHCVIFRCSKARVTHGEKPCGYSCKSLGAYWMMCTLDAQHSLLSRMSCLTTAHFPNLAPVCASTSLRRRLCLRIKGSLPPLFHCSLEVYGRHFAGTSRGLWTLVPQEWARNSLHDTFDHVSFGVVSLFVVRWQSFLARVHLCARFGWYTGCRG